MYGGQLMYNNYKSNYQCNYDFVPFNKSKFYEKAGKGNLTGYAELKLVTLGYVHIGSGFSSENKGSFVLETIKDFDNKPIIPASSIKGTVRNICSAISDGCLPRVDEKYKYLMPKSIRCSDFKDNNNIIRECCIICDMFGMIGKVSLASKISFTDFKATEFSLENKWANQQFSPNMNNGKYKDGSKFKGYKFYYTSCDVKKSDKQVYIETIKPKSEFIGKVFFKNITEDELQLLLFACGTDGYINLKIGGFKNDGFGEVACYCEELVINGEVQEDPISWAEKYPKEYGEPFKDSIEKLGDILYPSDES